MPVFPRGEKEIVSLVERMIAGYAAHRTLFPSSSVTPLLFKLRTLKNRQVEAALKLADQHKAAEAKNQALRELIEFTRIQLARSQADASQAENDGVLNYIGWGPRKAPNPEGPPGQVRNLAAKIQRPDTVILDWKAPLAGTGDRVRCYIIQRRENPGSGFTDWIHCRTALESEAILYQQPLGIPLEYRVSALNAAGEGLPSNTVFCI